MKASLYASAFPNNQPADIIEHKNIKFGIAMEKREANNEIFYSYNA